MGLNYQKANELLTGRNLKSRKLENNTYLVRHENNIAVRLHNTDILTFWPDGRTVFDSGGWLTLTTKDRINNYRPENCPLIIQDSGRWYFGEYKDFRDKSYIGLFANGATLWPDGKLTGIEKLDSNKNKKDKKLKAQIRAYAGLYVKDTLPMPDSGDCWYCYLREKDTNLPMGEVFKNRGHILEHIKEKYIVPSLAYRALESAGAGQAYYWALFNTDKENKFFGLNNLGPTIKRFIYRYICKQLGFAV